MTALIGAVTLCAIALTTLAGGGHARAQVIAPLRITSAGPLQEIYVGAELNCQMKHASDPLFLFFPSSNVFGACGTQLRLNGETYGPGNIPSGNQPTPFTPVSQSAVTGSGTAADPFTITTVVRAGTTAITLSQVDTYVVGQPTLQTQVTVRNTGDAAKDVVLYRAGDCYLDGLDDGLGETDGAGSVACRQANGRTMRWTPGTGGSTYMEGPHTVLWELVQNGHTFPNTAQTTGIHNNAAGLAWTLTVPGGGQAAVASALTVDPPVLQPVTVTATADPADVVSGAIVNCTLTFSNPNTRPVELGSMSAALPFAYVQGSTSGATTADPAMSPNTLTWSGGFPVAAGGSTSLTFAVRATPSPGIYAVVASGRANTAGLQVVSGGALAITVREATTSSTTTTTAPSTTATTTTVGPTTTVAPTTTGASTTTTTTAPTTTTSTAPSVVGVLPAGLVIAGEPTVRPTVASTAATTIVAPTTASAPTAAASSAPSPTAPASTATSTASATASAPAPTTVPAIVAGIQVERGVAFTGSDGGQSVAEFAAPLTALGALLYAVSRLRRRSHR